MAFFSTPDIERLYSGVTKISPRAALISAFKRFTGSAGLASSSWLYRGRSSILTSLKETSAGASLEIAVASLRLNESRRRLPTTTAIGYWLTRSPFGVLSRTYRALRARGASFSERRSEEPRLNSSHSQISYAVFCLKKKKKKKKKKTKQK